MTSPRPLTCGWCRKPLTGRQTAACCPEHRLLTWAWRRIRRPHRRVRPRTFEVTDFRVFAYCAACDPELHGLIQPNVRAIEKMLASGRELHGVRRLTSSEASSEEEEPARLSAPPRAAG